MLIAFIEQQKTREIEKLMIILITFILWVLGPAIVFGSGDNLEIRKNFLGETEDGKDQLSLMNRDRLNHK